MPQSEYISALSARARKEVTEAIRAFAEKTRLEAEFWVHDLPLWFLSSVNPEEGIIRRLQVGAYAIDEADVIRVIPQVFRLKKERRALIAYEQIKANFIRDVPIEGIDRKTLEECLATAWKDALQMTPPEPLDSASSGVMTIEVSRTYNW